MRRAPKAGQLQRNPDLANTFKLLGAEGAAKGPSMALCFMFKSRADLRAGFWDSLAYDHRLSHDCLRTSLALQ